MVLGLVKMLPYLSWPLAVVLLAWAQGWLMPAIRRTPPGAEARRQDKALHWLLTAAYFLPLVVVLWYAPHNSITHGIIAGLARLLLFDPVLNRAAGDKVFAVGQTAASDRAIRWLAQKLGMQAEHLRALLWGLCLVLAICLLVIVNS
jgi:hypothetical protein